MTLRTSKGALLCALALVGCASTAEQHLLDAKAALDRCDMAAAHESFEAAYAEEPTRADAALGFALTDAVLLPEDPAVVAALSDIGFTGPIDTAIFWGPDGVLARLQRDESCDSIETYLENNVPYPPLRDSSIDGADRVRQGLTAQDMLTHLTRLDARLERLAVAFETAADGMEGGEVTIDGSCGIGRVVVQAPELYAAAAALVIVRSVIATAPAYDWSMEVMDIFGSGEEQVAALQQLLRVVNADRAAAGRPLMLRAVVLVEKAVAAAQRHRTRVADALFDWSAMDATVLSDLLALAEAAKTSLDAQQPVAVPFVTPRLEVNLARAFTSPPNTATLPSPMWVWEVDSENPEYAYQRFESESLEALLRPYFTTDPFDGTEYEWSIGDRWEDVELEPVLDPGDRWERVYSCE